MRDFGCDGLDVWLALGNHAHNPLTITDVAPLLLFVYGSLKRGFRHHGALRGAPFERLARTAPCYRLVRVGEYPVLLAQGSEHVMGELYRVSQALLEELDRFEGPTYLRAIVTLEDTSEVVAYAGDAAILADQPPVVGGEWTE